MFVLYALLLTLLASNSYRVLWVQEKWKQLPMSAFYALSFVIIAMRIIFFSFILSAVMSPDRAHMLKDMKT